MVIPPLSSKTLLSGQVAMSLNLQTANIQHQLIVFAFRVLWTDPTIKQRICEYICSDINLNRFGLIASCFIQKVRENCLCSLAYSLNPAMYN